MYTVEWASHIPGIFDCALEVLKVVVTWPGVFLIIAFIFRVPIRSLLNRVIHVQGAGFAITIAATVDSSIKQAIAQDGPPTPLAEDTRTPEAIAPTHDAEREIRAVGESIRGRLVQLSRAEGSGRRASISKLAVQAASSGRISHPVAMAAQGIDSTLRILEQGELLPLQLEHALDQARTVLGLIERDARKLQ